MKTFQLIFFLTLLDTLRNGSFWNRSLDRERGGKGEWFLLPKLSDLPKGDVTGLEVEPYPALWTVSCLAFESGGRPRESPITFEE